MEVSNVKGIAHSRSFIAHTVCELRLQIRCTSMMTPFL